MAEQVIVRYLDDVYLQIDADKSALYSLKERFTFKVPGYQFTPSYKSGFWDGSISLLNLRNRTIYAGLLEEIKDFCKDSDFDLEVEDHPRFLQTEFSLHEAEEFIKTLKIPECFEQRDYQIQTFVRNIRENRSLVVSPTASGKSYLIYLLLRYLNKKTLIIVPNLNLVHQMYKDFEDYGYDVKKNCHKIYAEQEKVSNAQVYISTWQSIWKLNQDWFDQFDVVICDECHKAKAKCITDIMTKLKDCPNKFGFTGTLDGTQTHKMILTGLFGPVRQLISTKELQDQNYLSDLKIKAIVLKHSQKACKALKDSTYHEEADWICASQKRNNFIKNLALSLKGNTLILYQFIEKHGDILNDLIRKESKKPVFYIHGEVKGTEREEIRQFINNNTEADIIASMGCFAEGINIPGINNIIFAFPSKSKIKVLQMIGRGLRKSEGKEECVLFDLVDNLKWKNRKNYALKHFEERFKYYIEEDFPVRQYDIELKEEEL
jgi:superfamily II DNA or RNA helicase